MMDQSIGIQQAIEIKKQKQILIDYIMEMGVPIIKKTISYIDNAITSEVRIPCAASVRILFLSNVHRKAKIISLVEGEVVNIPMYKIEHEKIAEVYDLIENGYKMKPEKYITGSVEVILIINESTNKFGIAMIDYFSPENW